jgi:hypothetical protein
MQTTPSRVSILSGREVRGGLELTCKRAVVRVAALGRDFCNAVVSRFQQLARMIDPQFHQELFRRQVKHFTGQTFQCVDRDGGSLRRLSDQDVLSKVLFQIIQIFEQAAVISV